MRQVEIDDLVAEWLIDPADDFSERCPECGASSEHGEMCNECVNRMFPGMF